VHADAYLPWRRSTVSTNDDPGGESNVVGRCPPPMFS
jgi:hypothetical protein